MKALPAVARRTSSNPEAYVYLAESIRAWPDQRALAADIAACGWGRVQWRNLTGGIVALAPGEPSAGGVTRVTVGHYAFVGREVIHKCANREEMRA